MSTFYRIHWTDLPEFAATNAWSSLTGIDRQPGDPSKSECQMCDGGEGEWTECGRCKGMGCTSCGQQGGGTECSNCDGTGWADCIRGYSCFSTPEALVAYFTDRSRPTPAADETVVVFDGWQADTGFDDEPTAVPEHIIETVTWAEFVARETAGSTR